jgi:hypothetical protein
VALRNILTPATCCIHQCIDTQAHGGYTRFSKKQVPIPYPLSLIPIPTREEIRKIRKNYPELASWGDLAIGTAWGDYSQEVHMISWIYYGLEKRDEDFLNYLCWNQSARGPARDGQAHNRENRERGGRPAAARAQERGL